MREVMVVCRISLHVNILLFYTQSSKNNRLDKFIWDIGQHAEIKIGDSSVMLADPFEQGVFRPPNHWVDHRLRCMYT
jgi:uncharacterized glyoxalase superfamily protein PhnB